MDWLRAEKMSVWQGLLLAGLILCLSLHQVAAKSSAAQIISPKSINHELQKHLVWDYYAHWATDLNWERLREFYAARSFSPVWFVNDQTSPRAFVVRNALLNADVEGLDPVEYHAPAIDSLWRAKKARSKARLELLLTDALLRYVVEVRIGYSFPKAVDHDWHITPQQINALEEINKILTTERPAQYLAELPPPQEAYLKLKNTLAHYRSLAIAGDWPIVDNGPNLQVGMSHPQILEIKQRLLREDYLSINDNVESDYFDETLDQAIRQFQANYGHKVDGIVGFFTRKSMNISLVNRITTIKQNMERWRWVPRELGERYIMVNMAGYQLDLVDKGKSVLEMPVIVGKPYRASPAFIDNIDYVELNPTWKVPPRIAKEKFLPKLQKDPGFLARNHLRIYDSWGKKAKEVNPDKINWKKYGDNWLPYKFEQKPGKHNSMGLIKFMFPNKYRIYLHDTPRKDLFQRYVRTFSAGCIRVSKPFELASKILHSDSNWTNKKIESLIQQGETKVIKIKQPLPVYLMYWTAWVDENGKMNFRNDVYQRNKFIATSKENVLS